MPPASAEASRWEYRLAVIETSECPAHIERRCSSIPPSASRVMQEMVPLRRLATMYTQGSKMRIRPPLFVVPAQAGIHTR